MKILLVSNFADCGGVESVIREIANIYTRSHEVHFLYFHGKCNINFNNSVKIHFINNHGIVQKPSLKLKREIKRFFGMRQLIKIFGEIDPDVVIAFKPFVGVAIAKLKKLFNFKLIVSLHGNYLSDTNGYGIEKLVKDFSNINILTVLTESSKLFYDKYLHCKVLIAPNPINLPKFDIKKENIICCVGRIDNDKRTDLFIKAVALCQDQLHDYRFIIAGDGSEFDNMKKLAKKIASRVEFVGKLSQIDTYELYAKSKISVLCSESEGYPFALVEPMFYKCVRVSTRFIGGALEMLIKDGIDGYVCEATVEDLARVIIDVSYNNLNDVALCAYNNFQDICKRSTCFWSEVINYGCN